MSGQAIAIARKDMLVEARSRQTLVLVVLATLLITSLVALGTTSGGLSFKDDETDGGGGRAGLVSMALWVTIAIASVIAMSRSFTSEAAGETLDGLMLCPMDRSAIFLGKMLSNMVFLFLIVGEAVALYFMFGMMDPGGMDPLLLGAVMVAGIPGMAAITTTMSAMGAHSRSRETLVLVLFVPLALYTIILPGISATAGALLGEGIGDVITALEVMALSSAVYVGVCYALFDNILPD